jgi:hypothetical protein
MLLAACAAVAVMLAGVALTAAAPGTVVAAATLSHSTAHVHVPGALPFAQQYDDSYRGWPVAPVHSPHGIYSDFLNPGCGCPSPYQPHTAGYPVFSFYHAGIDIPVNDVRPDPGAPPGLSHAVYAVEGGRVSLASPSTTACKGRRVHIGHFGYGHVAPIVAVGDVVAPGQQIGWTCLGEWHVHLSEWLISPSGDHIPVNPIRPGGKLRPVSDQGKPSVSEIRFYADGRRVSPNDIRGTVEPIALAWDRFPFVTWSREPRSQQNVYAMWVTVRHPGGAFVADREVYRADTEPAPLKEFYYRPLTTRNVRIADCVTRALPNCSGRYWIRLWPDGWNTSRLPAGPYVITVRVADTVGHTARRSIMIRVVH